MVRILGRPEEGSRNPFSLDGDVAVVTGAASGIGREAARVFAEAGARLLLIDRDAAGLGETAARLSATAADIETVVADVSRQAEVAAAAARAVAHFGRIDIWANAAGVLGIGTVVDVTEAELDRILAVNLKGTYFGCAEAAKAMRAQGRGAIVNIASAGGEMPAPGLSAYAMSKAAVLMLTKTLAVELGPAGVRVNAVAPGFIDTPMVARRFTREDGTVDDAVKRAVFADRAGGSPLNATGAPWDIAMAMLYLAADASRFVTGQTLRPNGGVHMV